MMWDKAGERGGWPFCCATWALRSRRHLRGKPCRTVAGWMKRHDAAVSMAYRAKGSHYRDSVLGGNGTLCLAVHLKTALEWVKFARICLQQAERIARRKGGRR